MTSSSQSPMNPTPASSHDGFPDGTVQAMHDVLLGPATEPRPVSSGFVAAPGQPWTPPVPEELQPHFPQYEIRSLLGRGGMGAVYLAWQKSLSRHVAIKVMPPVAEDANHSFAERFKQEARSMAQLNHPGIIAVYDAGETLEGLLYFVMEYIEGTDVHQMVAAAGKLPPEHALAITAHVCEALAYAHAAGIIHRDIKPANIMVDRQGNVKVADFGLAKLATQDTGLTQTNMTMGTPDFVSPEALMPGMPLDGRADLYAVGVMLYQMLTGKIPRGAWLPASTVVPGLDPRWDEIICKAMQMDREARHSSAVELRQHLDSLHRPQVPPTSPASRAKPAAPFHRNRKHAMIAATTAILAAGAFFVLKPTAQPEKRVTSEWALGQQNATPPASAPTASVVTSDSFIGEWEDFPKSTGTRVVLFKNGQAQLWRDGKQDSRPDGSFYFGRWTWRMKGEELELLDEQSEIVQTWKADGLDTVTVIGKKTTQKKRGTGFWTNVMTVHGPGDDEAPTSGPVTVKKPEELTALQSQYDKLIAEQVMALFDADVAKLNTSYLGGLERAEAGEQAKGHLEAVLALQAEKKRITASQPVPPDDASTPQALKDIRVIYRDSLTKLQEQRTANHTAILTPYITRLKQLETDFTKAGRIQEAVAIKQYREGLNEGASPAKTPDATADAKPATSPMPLKGDARKAAEWVLSQGGSIFLHSGTGRTIKNAADLPEKLPAFGVVLDARDGTAKNITDADLDRLAGLDKLKTVTFRRLQITGAGIRFFETCPNVTEVAFEELPVNESWFSHLKKLRQLKEFEIVGKVGYRGLGLDQIGHLPVESLRLFRSNFNDEGLALLRDFKELLYLNIEETDVTDAGMRHLVDKKKLRLLNLGTTKVTAEGLAPLRGLPVVELGLGGTIEAFREGLPEAGRLFPEVNKFMLPRYLSFEAQDMELLGRAFPKLNSILTFNNKGISDATCIGFATLKNLRNLSIISAGKITDAGVAEIAKISALQSLTLHDSKMTDRSLEILQANKTLKNLFIHTVPVSEAGLAAFRKARPDVMVER